MNFPYRKIYARLVDTRNNKTYDMITQELTIGRTIFPHEDQVADLGIGDFNNISRLHARIYFDSNQQQFFIQVMSKNGLSLNGKRVNKGTSMLHDKDVLSAGTSKFQFLHSDFDKPVEFSDDDDDEYTPPPEEEDEEPEIVPEEPEEIIVPKTGWKYHDGGDGQYSALPWSDFNIEKPLPRCTSTKVNPKTRFKMLFDTGEEETRYNALQTSGLEVYYDIHTFLSWAIWKTNMWNIRGNKFLDPRVEYGVDALSKFKTQIEKWDVVYLGLRFFKIKDIINLKTSEHVKKFFSRFFNEKQLNKWRSEGRCIVDKVLQQYFSMDVVNANQKLLEFAEGCKNWDEDEMIFVKKESVKKAMELDKKDEEYFQSTYS